MELAEFLRVLRRRWLLLLACVVAGVAAAGVIAALTTPMYEARIQLFVSSSGDPADLDQAYEGGLLAQQRARSYAELATSPAVARAVIDELGLRTTPEAVQRNLEASVPVDTVLIDVSARAETAQGARALADAVADRLPRFVSEIESAPGAGEAAVRLSVASRPELPTDPASPNTPVYLLLGLLLGLVLGVTAALIRNALDDRVRTDAQAVAAADLPLLAALTDRGGASKALRDTASPAMEGYRRLRMNVATLAGTDRVRLLITSASAELDTGRVTVGLGTAFAQAGQSVVLVDANLSRPRLDGLLDLPAWGGLGEVLRHGVPVTDALQQWAREPRVEVLPAGAPLRPASDALDSPRLAEVIESLAARADVVIVDAPALPEAADAAVLARFALTVLLAAPLAATRTAQLESAVRELHAVDARILGIVTMPAGSGRG